MAARATLGPLTVLPTMKVAALAADRAAGIIAEEVEHSDDDTTHRTVSLRGPEEATVLQICQAILAARGRIGGRRPRFMSQAPYLGRAVATGGLIPDDAVIDDLTLDEWLSGPRDARSIQLSLSTAV